MPKTCLDTLRPLLAGLLVALAVGCTDDQVDACYADADGDGVSICDGDCDDTNPDVDPNLPEACDGIDNDCDGELGIGDGDDADEGDPDDDGFLNCEDCDPNRALIPSELPCP